MSSFGYRGVGVSREALAKSYYKIKTIDCFNASCVFDLDSRSIERANLVMCVFVINSFDLGTNVM